MTPGTILRLLLIAALVPILSYYVGDLLVGEGMWPVWHWGLAAAGLAAAVLAGIAAWWLSPGRAGRLLQALEGFARYSVAYLLVAYALNKLLPGQFLFYNRDLDMPLREVPARRAAWHFLGYSPLYIRFMAASELLAAALLCWSRTAIAGLLVSAGLLANIVVIDTAFGIPALPIPSSMGFAVLVLLGGHFKVLRSVIWREGFTERPTWTRYGLLSLCVLVAILGVELRRGLRSGKGLMSQLPAAGRWEVMECVPRPRLPICQLRTDGSHAILYLEIGRWGQLITDSGRQDLQFSYGGGGRSLEIRIQPRDSTWEATLVLRGTVGEVDTFMTLLASQPGSVPFRIRLRRTHYAPWPPTGWAR